ncbi:hypothetical protein PG614_05715 [Riemerella anatipestifer]|nr:hypothetical protein [Riemerella anatipestifer]MDY3532964.1 hypothetical protein [Riemerella anatipestifer]MDY3535437.1 hypothetical protein [Riemerella anatipestifer]
MKEKNPKTEIELQIWMKDNCFNFDAYSINGNFIWEGFGIDKIGSLFHWYYTERGQKYTQKIFRTEEEVVEFAFNLIKSDKWAKTHCIGFNYDKEKARELVLTLEKLEIEYLQDEIPFKRNQNVFRTFVFGCDIKKVEHLKEKYYNVI